MLDKQRLISLINTWNGRCLRDKSCCIMNSLLKILSSKQSEGIRVFCAAQAHTTRAKC
jgi:hypothetical protein